MARRPVAVSDPIPKRRRYDLKKGSKQVADDLVTLCQAKTCAELPDRDDLKRWGFENLASAMFDLGYHRLASETGIPPDPFFFNSKWHLWDEIYRVCISPQWEAADDDDNQFQAKIPDYSVLREHPEILAGLVKVGGMMEVFPPDKSWYGVSHGYYANDDNLKSEIGIRMRSLRTKMMPTMSQLVDKSNLFEEAILAREGYLATAARLGLPANPSYLRDPKNLWLELYLVEIARAKRQKERMLESGIPDCYLSHMPTEREIRAIKRPDLHKAVEAMGGYFKAAEAMDLWLPARFWEGNPCLVPELRRIAAALKRPGVMPTRDQLIECGRKDLAKAIEQNGGYRKTAQLSRLRPAKALRRTEIPLAVWKDNPALPYPQRRFLPVECKSGQWTIGLEVPMKTTSATEEYGVWLLTDRPAKGMTLGRVGWIRRRPGKESWWHRSEGESHWKGGQSQTMQEALDAIAFSATA
jgi:hypothetical protein